MRWVYGKQDWKTLERGQENCYLMTNGLGGFSSLTMTGSASRNDHAFFMGCVKAPNTRVNLVHRLQERLDTGERSIPLSSQEFADGSREEGYRFLSEFSYEDTPLWRFLADGVEVEKEGALGQGENRAAVLYRIRNRSRREVCLTVTPFVQFVPKGEELAETQTFLWEETRICSRNMTLEIRTNGEVQGIPETEETYYYSYDACDGRNPWGRARSGLRIQLRIPGGSTGKLAIVFELTETGRGSQERIRAGRDSQEIGKSDRDSQETGRAGRNSQEITGTDAENRETSVQSGEAVRQAEALIEDLKAYRRSLEEQAGFASPLAGFLVKSADQFVSARESTGQDTILAGFPFFEDWGRDTMIALPGVCISTGRVQEACSILRTFACYEQDGLMPNLFPEGGKPPMYNTVDAALLFINGVWLCCQARKDTAFVREMYPVMKRIIQSYQTGTRHGIRMDQDGLIQAGEGLDQVTWMDVRVGEILPTPRHGKPVEINAYWYNALRIMAELAPLAGEDGGPYEVLARQVKSVFPTAFWMEEKHCLRDVISGTDADTQIRCNQIWAVSMPFTMLDPEKERQVVDTVFEKLYTPYGLRTLSMEDPQFQPAYGGELMKRDLAYHQGTVWVFPLGAYYLAYLKVNGYSARAAACVRSQIEVLESAMREGCIGQLPEIYDGENPTSSRGCFAQAWSVGEILRVYEALEKCCP